VSATPASGLLSKTSRKFSIGFIGPTKQEAVTWRVRESASRSHNGLCSNTTDQSRCKARWVGDRPFWCNCRLKQRNCCHPRPQRWSSPHETSANISRTCRTNLSVEVWALALDGEEYETLLNIPSQLWFQLGGLFVVPHRRSITSSIRRRARRSLRFAALRLIPRIAAASATLCCWMSQRRNTSRQLRRNCKACISAACITPDGILGCSVDKRSRKPFTWSGSVIVKVDIELDIPVTGYPFSWRKIDDMHFYYGRGKASRLTPKPSRTAPAKLKNDASPPGGNRPPSGCW
jgi:hypothetical protein